MKRKLLAALLTALLALAVGMTSALAQIVLPDVPALDLEDMVDIAAIEAGAPQVTCRVENGELIAEGDNIDSARLATEGPNGYQAVDLTYHAEDGTWRAPCESLSIQEGYIELIFCSNEYRRIFNYNAGGEISAWDYTEEDSRTHIWGDNNTVIVSYPQARYEAFYSAQGELSTYEYQDKLNDEVDLSGDVQTIVAYDAEGNLISCQMNIYGDMRSTYYWRQSDGCWTNQDYTPCDPPAGYENLIGAEEIKAFMPPLVVVEQPEQPQVNLPDKPALNLSDIDIDFAAIEELLPQGTYRVENGELIVEGNDKVEYVNLYIYSGDEMEHVELTYHQADGTWRAPCESLEMENTDVEICLVGENCEYSYSIEGNETSSHWRYTINNDITILKRSDNVISVWYDSAKYSARYNAAGELEQYDYSDKTYEEINWDDDKLQTISYDSAGNVVWFNLDIIKDDSSMSYYWDEIEGWTLDGDPCDPPAGYENLKTAEDFKALMPPLAQKPQPVIKPQATWYPHNTLCVAGFYLKDEFPGLTDKWYNVVPVDISHDGTTVIPLVASGANVLGSATVQVKGDKVTVTYDLKNYMKHIYNESECLCWFTSVSDITTEFLNNPTPNAQFGKAVSISEDLNGQDVALLFICNRVLYRLPLDDKGTMPARYWSNSGEWVLYRERLRPLLEMVP